MTTGEFKRSTPNTPEGNYRAIKALLDRAPIKFDEGVEQFTRHRTLTEDELLQAAKILQDHSIPAPKSVSLNYQTGEIDTTDVASPQSEIAAIIIEHAEFTAVYGFYRDETGGFLADKSIQPREVIHDQAPEITLLIGAIGFELAASSRIGNALEENIRFDTMINPTREPNLNELRALAELIGTISKSPE